MSKHKHTNLYEPTPLDFLLLELLPEQGMIGGVHWKGRRVVDLRNELGDGVTTGNVQGRLRSMHVAGLVDRHVSVGRAGVKIWSRTLDGSDLLARKTEVLG
jgi:hypothetical protein